MFITPSIYYYKLKINSKEMKKILVILLLFVSANIYADGLETFVNYPETGSSYHDGTFVGQDGSTWTYYQCRGDKPITDETPCLGKGRDPIAEVSSGTISGGCLTLNFDYMQAFSTNVNLQVYVNSILVATVTSSGETGVVKNSGDINVNIPGDVVFKFIQADNSAGQVSIDNVAWTSGGSINPEPTNYPENFNAVANNYSINLSWEDATGEQLPLAYLIIGSETDDIEPPEDGTPVEDDNDLSDGYACVNVTYGIENYTFNDLVSATKYYFKIYPYTNSGSNIDYKTDGTAPEDSANIPNIIIINSENFDENWGEWTTISVIGNQEWSRDTIHGVGNTPCAKMSGYEQGDNHTNQDWLISPALNFSIYENVTLLFKTASNYSGPALEVKISTDYDGTSDPNTATWTDLNAELSSGGWTWTPSGNVDVSSFNSENVYIAFKYTSTDDEAATWEVDDIQIIAYNNVGINNPYNNNVYEIYPNPTNGMFFLKFNKDIYSNIKVYSITSKLIFENNLYKKLNKIDLSNVEKGIYIIQINDLNSNKIISKKLIIK